MRPLPVADPCQADWHELRADGPHRHCVACDRRVYDLRGMRAAEIQALLMLRGATGLCARQVLDVDGALVVVAEPVPARRAPGAAPLLAAALALVVGEARAGETVASECTPPSAAAGATAGAAPVAPAATETSWDLSGVNVAQPQHVVLGGIGPPQILEHVQFARGGATLDEDALYRLRLLAEILQAEPQIFQVSVRGHVSKDELKLRGGTELALRRAEAARDQLIALGVEPARLVALDAGDDEPAGPDSDPVSREQNRQVDFKILKEGR